MITYLIIYIIGVILTYGRINAYLYNLDVSFINNKKNNNIITLMFCTLSWYAFIIGVIGYFLMKEKKFLKYKK